MTTRSTADSTVPASQACLCCGGEAVLRFRPVLGRRRLERLCSECADSLSALVRTAGETALLSLADARFAGWLETGQWQTRDGRTLGPEDLPSCGSSSGDSGGHGVTCACCATFAEEAG